MAENIENIVPTQENKEKIEKHLEILNDLATAFGGYSQVPDNILGMAIVGQINNNGLIFGPKQLNDILGQISDRWDDIDLDFKEIRLEIIKGMKEEVKSLGLDENDTVVTIIHELEK